MEISLSKGNEQDLVAVIALVKELAKFENAGDEVEIGLEDYITGFRNGDFETILATFNKEIVGMALYYLTWSTWRGRMLYLEDLV
ncbi:MAG: GNAT family N-acetyltransferase, partial [Saprospiraceae bacterium]|nr:GNAT family N-acetyltransferase [Saprospiraceae bacterium]